MTKKWTNLLFLSLLSLTGQQAGAQTLDLGPAVGAPVPVLEGLDQYGKARSFEDLRGPKGLLLLFHRSADW